jgi:AAA15 family ATPase/GTPase
MMMLEQFTVENFKAFKSLELKDLGHINIFVGDNNVGKTCLLQALALSYFTEQIFPYEKKDAKIRKFQQLNNNTPFNNMFYKLQTDATIRLLAEGGKLKFTEKEGEGEDYSEWETELDNFHWLKINTVGYEAVIQGSNAISQHIEQEDCSLELKSDIETFNSSERKESYYCEGGWFCLPTNADYKQLAIENFKYFVDEDLEAEARISDTLKVLDKRLKDIRYTINTDLNAQLTIGLEGMPKRLPLESMGDGFAKLLGLACCLEQEGSKYLCIDEPENGFHYKTQTSFWKLLANWSLEGDKQSFIATHSYELISCLNDLLTADPTLLERGLKVRVHKLFRDENDPEKINVKTVDEKGLDWLLAHEMEIR